jgi:predicted metal-binding membrane protein
LAQWALERAALLTPMMEGASEIFGSAVLIAAGLYQWTPVKDACLRQCQAPWLFIQRHGGFRRDAAGSLGLGVRHGAYCVGCCWALMALLFVGGIMNVMWIAAIAILALVEKVSPVGRTIARIAGVGLFAGGAWLLATALR